MDIHFEWCSITSTPFELHPKLKVITQKDIDVLEMNKITVRNLSDDSFRVSLSEIEDVPQSPENIVVEKRGQTSIPITSDGKVSPKDKCIKLSIWSMAKDLLWCGIIPIMQSEINVDPKAKMVAIGSLRIPECPKYKEGFGSVFSDGPVDLRLIPLSLILILGVWLLIKYISR